MTEYHKSHHKTCSTELSTCCLLSHKIDIWVKSAQNDLQWFSLVTHWSDWCHVNEGKVDDREREVEGDEMHIWRLILFGVIDVKVRHLPSPLNVPLGPTNIWHFALVSRHCCGLFHTVYIKSNIKYLATRKVKVESSKQTLNNLISHHLMKISFTAGKKLLQKKNYNHKAILLLG